MSLIIRQGIEKDLPQVHGLIKELAVYERAPGAVTNTLEAMKKDGFGDKPIFDFIVAEEGDKIIGFALYYFSYSTWKGRCIYLEDFYVKEAQRGKGIGKLLFEEVIKIAREEKVVQMKWQVLDWNEPAINFYKKYNAELDGEWFNGRLTGEQLRVLGS